ncbi:MAG: CAP domain-containing protein [Butyrivibrio sp.]|nr:CAP domain-containing protein [Butyrivibrio sp.]
MKKLFSLILIAATIIVLMPVKASAATDEDILLGYINGAREQAGLTALTVDAELTKAAQVRAQESRMKFSHTRPDGAPFYSVSVAVNAENLAAAHSYNTLEEVFSVWMSSPSHKANILYPSSTKTGFGIYKADDMYYVAEEFD